MAGIAEHCWEWIDMAENAWMSGCLNGWKRMKMVGLAGNGWK